MKEIIYTDEMEELEASYLEQNRSWKLEKMILESFPKRELKEFIEQCEKEYMREYMPYAYGLSRKKFRMGYENLGELGRFLLERYSHVFEGGKELEMHKNFLEKLKRYYKEHYESSKIGKRKDFDIHTLSIEEVISRYISLPNSLKRNICCPLHKDKTASFRIYPKTQSFYCYGCHKGGNAVNFVSEIEKISLKEAFKKLAHLYSKY